MTGSRAYVLPTCRPRIVFLQIFQEYVKGAPVIVYFLGLVPEERRELTLRAFKIR